MDSEKVNELSELFSAVSNITIQHPNEHLPYTTITLLFHSDENARLCLELINELAAKQGIVRN